MSRYTSSSSSYMGMSSMFHDLDWQPEPRSLNTDNQIIQHTLCLSDLLEENVYPHTMFKREINTVSMHQFGKWLQQRCYHAQKEFRRLLERELEKFDKQQIVTEEKDHYGVTTCTLNVARCLELKVELITKSSAYLASDIEFISRVQSRRNEYESFDREDDYSIYVGIHIADGLDKWHSNIISRSLSAYKLSCLTKKVHNLLFKDIEQNYPDSMGVKKGSTLTQVNRWNHDIARRVYFPTSGEMETGIMLWFRSGFLDSSSRRDILGLLKHVGNNNERLLDAVEWLNQNGINIYPTKTEKNQKLETRGLIFNTADNGAPVEQANTFCYLQLPAALVPTIAPPPAYRPPPVKQPTPPKYTYTGKILTSTERRQLDNQKALELVKHRSITAVQNSIDALKSKITKLS